MVHVTDLLSLKGKSALVTGANGGIGRAMATALAEAGADVVIFQIPGDTDDTTAQEIKKNGRRTQTYDCDLASSSEIRSVMSKVFADGWNLDVLVNCAGISKHSPILDMTDELKDRVLFILQ
jgi:2-dehydro-3-deoxy-D-gluconate 5-dehydrogenase